MEEEINLITSAEANKYLWQQVKQLLTARGFIVCPNKPKYMVRLREHYLQMVYQEISYGATNLRAIVLPAWTYQEGWFFSSRISLRRTNTNIAGLNLYSEAAYRQNTSLKTYFDRSELVTMWEEAIHPQLQEELIEYFDNMDFQAYADICVNRGDRSLRYGSSCDGVRLLAIGYNSLWMQQYEKAREFIRKAIAVMQELEKRRAGVADQDSMFLLDLRNGEEILGVLESSIPDREKKITEMLCGIERSAMERTMHIALNDKNETIKVRKEKQGKQG